MNRAPAPRRDADGPSIAEEAARWHLAFVEQGHDGGKLRAAFEHWCAEDAGHRRAYEEVEAAWRLLRIASSDTEILALRQETLTRLVMRGDRRFARGMIGAGMAAALVVGGGGWLALRNPFPEPARHAALAETVYRTRIGERLTVSLADGSTATLNTSSRVRVHYGTEERGLILEQGQAYFKVAKDPARPFHVVAGDRDIVALGTAFDVRVDRDALTVALLEGEVTVIRADGGQKVHLQPNELLIARKDAHAIRRIRNPDAVTSWSDGVIIFQDQSVGQAVAEMNRYLTRPIVIEGSGLSSQKVSGTFRTGEAGAFIEALRHYYPLEVDERRSDRISISSGIDKNLLPLGRGQGEGIGHSRIFSDSEPPHQPSPQGERELCSR